MTPSPRTDEAPVEAPLAGEARTSKSLLPFQDLALLGLLMEGPQHGYEMKQHFEQRLGQLVTVSSGTVYYTLRKLEKRGEVEMTRDREGNRPEKMVYHITEQGRERFAVLLKQAFLEEDPPYCFFDVGLYFSKHGRLEDALAGAERQIERMKAFEAHVASQEEAHPFRWPFRLEAIKKHTLAVTRAHRAFYEELEKDLRARIARADRRSPKTTSRPKRRTQNG